MDAKVTQAQGGAGTLPARAGAGGPGELFRALGPARILALGAVALVLLSFFAFIGWRASAPGYTLLFAGMPLADSQRLVQRLDEMGVPHRLSAGGDAIMVPEDRALRLRMSLAEEGLPLGNALGNELLDQAGPFGTSEFLANVNLRRAMEGELARTIGTLRGVRSARVHVVQPKRELFARETTATTASIVLALHGGASLDKRQVAGIKHLVAAAVPGLGPDRVTLVDDSGTLLAQAEADGGAFSLGEAEERRVAHENRLKAKLVQLLERSVGAGRADAEVTADMDFDEVATTAETFDPNGQVVRSTQTSEEKSDAAERQPEEPVTVAGNLPTERVQQDAAAAEATSRENSNRAEETINYEISRTVRNQTRRGGVVRRLSIAVQVDGTYKPQPDGTLAYEPRSAEELQQLAALVRSAAGVDEERGDVVEVVSRQFVQPAAAADDAEAPLLAIGREEYWRAAELGTLAVVALLVLLLGVRPALRRIFPERDLSPAAAGPAATMLGADGTPLLAQGGAGDSVGVDAAGNPVAVRRLADAGSPAAGDGGAGLLSEPGPMLALGNVRGGVRASLVHDATEIVDARADEAVRVVRGWLGEG